MDKIWQASIMLSDINMEQLGEFMLFREESGQRWVKAIPYFGMHEMYRRDISNPITVHAGMTMPDTTFLGYIGNVVSWSTHNLPPGTYFQMTRHDASQVVQVNLQKGMHADRIASLTGYSIEVVRAFYDNYFVIETDAEKE